VPTFHLPVAGGSLAPNTTSPLRDFPAAKPPFSRIARAAGHVVADPLADCDLWLDCAIDWERTIAFHRHLWSLGLGVAEAMDTAQRGMGVDWPTSLGLIRRNIEAAKRFYKTGGVFMAYLNGLRDHFVMVGGQESAHSTLHFSELFRLADAAGLLTDPDGAGTRKRGVMTTHGVEA
jgi:hypothetical protein